MASFRWPWGWGLDGYGVSRVRGVAARLPGPVAALHCQREAQMLEQALCIEGSVGT